jgi:serine/threonine protein phosphatase PrpC
MSPPVFGRQSEASASEPVLRASGDSSVATWRAEGASTSLYSLRAASVTGISHRLAGRGCEDSFAWHSQGDILAVAVADGLGSVEGSAGAAVRAARAAVAAAVDGYDGPDPVADAVRAADLAAAGGGATTLVVAVLDPEGRVQLGRVGDSTAFATAEDGWWAELFAVSEEEYVRTETAALPSDRDGGPGFEPIQTDLAVGSILVLATDGVADPWRDGPSTVAPPLVEAIGRHPSALEVARLADFSRQGCHDDRTIFCVWRRV